MLEPKRLTKDGLAKAVERAERYRLLNEPVEAESICLDVLAVDGENQRALVMLLLALTDQFDEGAPDAVERAREVLPRLRDEYDRDYYAGIIAERRAKAQLRQGLFGAGYVAYELLHEAMGWYQKAEVIRPAGNDDALLRWNTCVRILQRRPDLGAMPKEEFEPSLE
jgi:hypothetical protein